MSLPTTFTAVRVSFAINPSDEPPMNSFRFEVEFPNLGASENEALNDAANAAALAAYASLAAAYPSNSFTVLRRYEGVEDTHTDITPS